MPGLPRRFKQLEKELLALGEETMLIEQLDGFVAGLLVCPDLIMPGEWLPVVWNPDGGDQEPAFDDIDHANRVLGLVREYYNDIARTLMERPDRYGPLLPMNKRSGDIIWELWIDGFEKAVALRPAAWERLLNADPDTEAAICGILGLVAVANGDEGLSEKESDTLSEAAPDSIGPWIVTLNEWRLANYRPAQGTGLGPNPFPAPTKKAGRNDPCPCGSGKKYKTCCGLN